VDPVALFASVGVLSLIVGLGAQSLISDIISGLFIVFEDEYEVGDIVVIDGFRGKVESIGIRTTQIVDAGGNKKVINNSEIVSIVNLSYDNSLISVEVAIPYDSLKQFETVFKENAEALKQQLPALVEGPKYVGPIDFGNDGLSVKIIAKVPEEGRFQAERDMRRAIFLLMETNNIDMPYETYNINASMDSK
jgi:small conductance mechanosensitive channel